MNSEDTRNIILFVVLSAFILIGWNFFFPPKPRRRSPADAPVAATTSPAANSASGPQGLAPPAEALKPREEALAERAAHQARHGRPRRLDQSRRRRARRRRAQALPPDHRPQERGCRVVLAGRDGRALLGGDRLRRRRQGGQDADPLDPLDRRRRDADARSSGDAHFRQWRGPLFKRKISVDDKYMFTVDDSVENKTDKPVSLRPYA